MSEYTVIGGGLEKCPSCRALTLHVNGACQKEIMQLSLFTSEEVLHKWVSRTEMLGRLPKVTAKVKRERLKQRAGGNIAFG